MLIEGEAKAKGVHVNISTDSNPGLIHVDAQQIQQVLLNLVVNSLQSMPEGGTLNLEIKRNKQLSDESQIVFSVADTGVGIPSEHLDLIFEPFFTTRKQGSGLGLALAYTLVTQNHGNIRVESKPNQGTTFFIRFPLYLENQEQSIALSA
jgi:signal transduction histidine kinase